MTDLSWAHRWLARGVAVLMVTNGMVAGTVAEPAEAAFDPWSDLRRDVPVEVTAVPAGGVGFVDPSADQVWDAEAAAVSVPPPGTVTFDLDRGEQTVTGALAGAGEVPVSVRRPDRWRSAVPRVATSGTVAVEIADQAVALAAGVTGPLVKLTPQGAGSAELTISYAGFADLFGGGWASRAAAGRAASVRDH